RRAKLGYRVIPVWVPWRSSERPTPLVLGGGSPIGALLVDKAFARRMNQHRSATTAGANDAGGEPHEVHAQGLQKGLGRIDRQGIIWGYVRRGYHLAVRARGRENLRAAHVALARLKHTD